MTDHPALVADVLARMERIYAPGLPEAEVHRLSRELWLHVYRHVPKGEPAQAVWRQAQRAYDATHLSAAGFAAKYGEDSG